MDSNFNTMAARLDLFDSDVDPWSIARIQFYGTIRDENGFRTQWFPAARCQDVYAEEMKNFELYQIEFAD